MNINVIIKTFQGEPGPQADSLQGAGHQFQARLPPVHRVGDGGGSPGHRGQHPQLLQETQPLRQRTLRHQT